MTEAALGGVTARLDELLRDRLDASESFFAAEAEPLASLCHRMAARFSRGGTLIAFGRSPAARSDARHVAVEFVHPVIVGKRALPAIGLAGEGGDLRAQVELVAGSEDIAIAFGTDEDDGEGRGSRGRPTTVLKPVGGRGNGDVRVHLVVPKSFNDAQQIADKFKDSIPVILNLQSSDTDLSKRLIDFASGLTYALDGGMQRIADKVFMLTPRNVEISAEERARLIEKGFFNQS